ncbi:MAG: protein-disulfide reductase DsbD family protein [Planctomycetota bacterium]|jgi:thiol:disulfide interchange protein DsbD
MLRRPLIALALLATLAWAEPTLEIGLDGGVPAFEGNAVDLLVTIDPGPAGVKVEGLAVTVEAPGAKLSAAILPPADEVTVYRAPFVVRVPMRIEASEPFDATVKVEGGHGNGKALSLSGKKTIYAAPLAGGGGVGFPAEEPNGTLKLNKAYLRDTPAKAGKLNALVLELEITGGQWHVYGEATKNDPKALGVPMIAEILPNGPEVEFLSVGEYMPPEKKYYGQFKIEVPVTPVKEGDFDARVKLFWQACDPNMCIDSQVIYPTVSWTAERGDGTIEDPMAGVAAESSEDGLAGQSLWLLFLGAIVAGLVALAMPCTYPLIPITISFFTKQGEQREGKTMGLALAYGAGIVVCFASIGAVVGLGVVTGEQVLDIATNPWVNGLFALLFLYFGLSLVGLYEINLPAFVQNFAAKAGGGGGYTSVFAMGATLVITSFTCTAPFVGALLVYAAASGDWTRVTAAMGVFGLTMAIPFVLLSLSPKAMANLPRSGIWMKHLKVVLGIVELGLVLKFLSNIDLAIGTRLIYRELFLLLWGASFLISALYLMDLPALFNKERKWVMGKGTAAAIIFLLGVTIFLYSGLGGKPLPNKYMEAFLPNWDPPYDKNFQAVVYEDYAAGIAKAQELNAPVFLHFTGFQ